MMNTLKLVGLGVWAVVAALVATYFAATWNAGATAEAAVIRQQAHPEGGKAMLHPAAITVPMIGNGELEGYVVVKVVFTADPAAMQALPFDPQPVVADAAFRTIYTKGRIEFEHLSKYNLDEITDGIKTAVNARFGAEFVEDVLIEELNYVSRAQLDKVSGGGTGH